MVSINPEKTVDVSNFDDEFEEDFEDTDDEFNPKDFFFNPNLYSAFNQHSRSTKVKTENKTKPVENNQLESIEPTFAVIPTKKVHSAWANLNITPTTNPNASIKTDNPAFMRSHPIYEKKIQEEELYEPENFTNEDLEIFYKEEIRRPLAGIHVEIDDEVLNTDW